MLLPLTADLDALYEEVWGWIYTDTAPTLAPTTAATTAATTPATTTLPSYEFEITDYLSVLSFGVNGVILSSIEGDVTVLLGTLIDAGYTFTITGSVLNDGVVTIIKATLFYYMTGGTTSFEVNQALVDEISTGGKLIATP